MSFLKKLFSGIGESRADTKVVGEALFGRTIFLLESSVTIGKIVELTVADTGANTFTFATTAEFRKGLSSAAPDIAILSVSDIDGEVFPFVQQIKSQFANARIVLLADISNRIDSVTASQHGVDEVFMKPFDSVNLLNALAGMVR